MCASPRSAQPLRARRPAVGIGVDDQLGAAAQRGSLAESMSPRITSGPSPPRDRVGAAVDPDQDRVARPRCRRAAPAGRARGRSPRTTISTCRSRKRVRVSGKSIAPESRPPSSRRWAIVFSAKSCSARSIRARWRSGRSQLLGLEAAAPPRPPSLRGDRASVDLEPLAVREQLEQLGPRRRSAAPRRERASAVPCSGSVPSDERRDVEGRARPRRRSAPRPRSGRGCGDRSPRCRRARGASPDPSCGARGARFRGSRCRWRSPSRESLCRHRRADCCESLGGSGRLEELAGVPIGGLVAI